MSPCFPAQDSEKIRTREANEVSASRDCWFRGQRTSRCLQRLGCEPRRRSTWAPGQAAAGPQPGLLGAGRGRCGVEAASRGPGVAQLGLRHAQEAEQDTRLPPGRQR